MEPSDLTDALVERLRLLPKRVQNPRVRLTIKGKHQEKNFDVSAVGGDETFALFIRQSILIPESFTAGLALVQPGGARLILVRYNGADHEHHNPIEGERFSHVFHIHTATERYAQLSRRVEKYAVETTRFTSVVSALKCLAEDWSITPVPDLGDLHSPSLI